MAVPSQGMGAVGQAVEAANYSRQPERAFRKRTGNLKSFRDSQVRLQEGMIVEHNPTCGTFELFWPGFVKQLFDLGKRRDYESLRKLSGLITASIHACTLPTQ